MVELAADGIDASDSVLELAPAALASILNAHVSLRRFALSPAFRGNTVPITDTAAAVLVGLDPEVLELLHVTEAAAKRISAAFARVTGHTLLLPEHLKHALKRIMGSSGYVKAVRLPSQAEAMIAA